MLTEEQLNSWLILLTLNLMVMSSIMLEILGKDLNTTLGIEEHEVKEKWSNQTHKQQ
jgi:hypothetical protein